MAFIGADTFCEIGDQGVLGGAIFACAWHCFVKFAAAEFGDARDEVAQDIREVFVDGGLEVFPCEFCIRAFGRVGQKPPAPDISGQNFQRLVHEDATATGCGELAAFIVEVVEGFDVIDELPRLARAQNGRGERERVEGDVILAHELGIGHIIGAFVGAPPAFPIRAFTCIDPFLGAGDIFDRRVKPDVEDLALHAGPVLCSVFDRDAPVQIAGDAAVLQAVAVIEPFVGDGGCEYGPVGFGVDPCLQIVTQVGLLEVEVLCFALFQIGCARDGGARIDQIGRVELFCAIVALIAARIFKAAIGAGAFDVAIWQEAAIGLGVDLCFADFFDQALAGESACKVLCECVVLGAGGAAEVIKAQAEAIGDLGLDIVHLGAIVRDRLASLGSGEFGGGSVLVSGA